MEFFGVKLEWELRWNEEQTEVSVHMESLNIKLNHLIWVICGWLVIQLENSVSSGPFLRSEIGDIRILRIQFLSEGDQVPELDNTEQK